jgi:hypothetical protein
MDIVPYDHLNVDMIVDKQPCLPTPDDSDPYLYYANASGSDDPCPIKVIGDPVGIKFTQPDNSSSGSYLFVQLVTANRVRFVSGNKRGAFVSIPGLDREYPYPPLAFGDLYVSDSPDTALVDPTAVYSEVSRTFSANMFLKGEEIPRLWRGGSSSLTFTGVHPRNSLREPTKAHAKEKPDGPIGESKPLRMGVQIPRIIHSQMPAAGAV